MSGLAVFLGGVRIGTVVKRAGLSFTYAEEYLASGATTPLSLSMPLRAEPYANRVVSAWVEGLLPASPAVRLRIAERGGVKVSDPVGLLAVVGLDCPGAVHVCALDDLNEADLPAVLTPVSDEWIADRLSLLRQDGAAWQVADERWSIGGGQSKFTLARAADGRWCDPEGSAASTHIVKPGIRSAKLQALNEHVCLTALRLAGVPAARSEYLRFGDETAVVVERFDRVLEPGGVVRRHAEDMCQALAKRIAYEHQGGPTARQILEFLGSRAGERSRLRFVEALIATYLLGSPDGHARNYSMLISGRGATLAPLYDVASSLPYDISGGGIMNLRKVAIAIAGERRFGMIGRDRWNRFFATNAIDPEWADGRLSDLADRLPDAVADAFTSLDDVQGSDELKPRLLDGVATMCKAARSSKR